MYLTYRFLNWIESSFLFNEFLVVSIVLLSISINLFLIVFVNPYFTYLEYTIHAYTIIVCLLMFLFAYYKLNRIDRFKRFFYSFCFSVLFFFVHDLLWNIAVLGTGYIIDGVRYYPDLLLFEIAGNLRNIGFIIICYAFLKKYFRVNKKFMFFFSIQLLYCFYRLIFAVDDIVILMFAIDMLPYIFLLKNNNGKREYIKWL